METIASFTVDHLTLEPGIYVSRVDRDPATGAVVTTFDIRLTAPNRGAHYRASRRDVPAQ